MVRIDGYVAIVQGHGETATTYATQTTAVSVEPVAVDIGALDKTSDFNEAKSLLH